MATKKTASERAIAKLTAAGHKPFSYSGRGMFGAECVAISAPDRAYAPRKLDGVTPRYDSLGKGLVAYWPHLPWPPAASEPTEPKVVVVEEPASKPAPSTKRTFMVTFEVDGSDAEEAIHIIDDLLYDGAIQELIAERAADQDKDFEIVQVYT